MGTPSVFHPEVIHASRRSAEMSRRNWKRLAQQHSGLPAGAKMMLAGIDGKIKVGVAVGRGYPPAIQRSRNTPAPCPPPARQPGARRCRFSPRILLRSRRQRGGRGLVFVLRESRRHHQHRDHKFEHGLAATFLC
jgi:hypothetical protein